MPAALTHKLDRSVQFLYEGYMAEQELLALGARDVSRSSLDWRTLETSGGDVDVIRRRSAFLGESNGAATTYSHLLRPAYQGGEFNRTRSPNQFLTHWIYPYRGKFHPQMVRGLLNILGVEAGMTVGDFYSGSGTTALEASLFGAHFIGVDISPLCVELALVKTESWRALDEITRVVNRVLDSEPLDLPLVAPTRASKAAKRFLRVAELVTISDRDRRGRDVSKALRKNLSAMLESVTAHARAIECFELTPGTVKASIGDARDLKKSGVESDSIDAVVTSPPYSIALDYVENDEHSLVELGVDVPDLRDRMTGVRGKGAKEKLQLYNDDMKRSIEEVARVLKPGGRAAYVVGDATVNGKEWTTTGDMLEWATTAGLTHERTIPKIVFGLYSVMKDESIILLRKP